MRRRLGRPRVADVLTERLGDLGVPVLGGMPVGHGADQLAVPVGTPAVLDTTTGTLHGHPRRPLTPPHLGSGSDGVRWASAPVSSAAHIAPSGPSVMPCGSEPGWAGRAPSIRPSGSMADAVGAPLGEPEGAVGAGDDGVRPGGAVGQRVLGDLAVRGDPADPAGGDLDEPERAVRARGDAHRAGGPGRQRVDGHLAVASIRPIALAWFSANHIPPSGPAVVTEGNAPVIGSGNSVTWPSTVILPIRSAGDLGEPQRAVGPGGDPERPAARWRRELAEGPRRRVIRPIRWAGTVNHSAPSGPTMMIVGPLPRSARLTCSARSGRGQADAAGRGPG